MLNKWKNILKQTNFCEKLVLATHKGEFNIPKRPDINSTLKENCNFTKVHLSISSKP